MKIITIIPARGGSKGIPKKNLADFCGKPLLQYSIEASIKCEKVSKTYVSSDDEEILSLSSQLGAVPIKRPDDISGDKATSESALVHVLQTIPEKPDAVCFLQATSPLRTSKDIENAIETYTNNGLDSLFSASPIEDFFVWHIEPGGVLKSLNHDFENRKRRQDISDQIVENGSIYIFNPDILTKHNNRLGGIIGYSLMESWKVHEIDSQHDLELCEFIYKQRIAK